MVFVHCIEMLLVGAPSTVQSFIDVSKEINDKMKQEKDYLLSWRAGTPLVPPKGAPEITPGDGQIAKWVTLVQEFGSKEQWELFMKDLHEIFNSKAYPAETGCIRFASASDFDDGVF